MTVTNTDNKDIYVGDGATLVFAYTYKIFLASDLIITITDTLGVNPELTLVLDADYTVSGVGSPSGGNITLLLTGQLSAAPVATDDITLLREEPLTQNLDYIENDDFPSQSTEDAMDKLTFITQQLQEQLNRAVLLAANITGVDLTLPTPEAGAPIGWNDTADGLTNNPDEANLSQIDAAATPDYIGATAADGVIRVGSNMTYVDGGDFVTLDMVASPSISTIVIATSLTLNGYAVTDILDEDTLVSDSATALATQQSIKAYVDAQIISQNEFTELTDTPANYTGDTIKYVRVNAGETALEFVNITAAEVSIADSGALYTATDVEGAFAENRPLINTNTADIGINVTAIGLNTTHRGSDGKDHSDVVTNNAKVSNATHTTDVTGSVALTIDPVAITNKPAGTVAGGDLILMADIDDSNNLKQVTAQSIADLGAGGGPVQILDEGISLTAAVSSIDFVGAGVTATVIGSAVTVTIAGGGGGATLTEDIVQATHGFSVNDWVYHNGTIYVLADASAAATAESIGIVSVVTDVNNFTLQFGGYITGLVGLTAGEAHFLSETAGAITATAPTTEGSVIKPVLIADSTTSGFIFNMRGVEVVGTTSWYQGFADGDLTAGVLTVTHNLGHKYCQVQIFNNSDKLIMPDDITLVDANSLTVDLTSYGTLTGTWQVVVLDVGTTASSVASDLSLAGQTTGDIAVYDGANWVAQPPASSGFVGFSAFRSGGNWLFPDNAMNTMQFNNEHFDAGGNFNTGTYQFTAPVTGYYHFTCGAYWAFLPANAGAVTIKLTTTTHSHWTVFYWDEISSVPSTRYGQNIAKTVFMTAGDTCHMEAQMATGTTGSAGLDDGIPTGTGSFFTGYLIGV